MATIEKYFQNFNYLKENKMNNIFNTKEQYLDFLTKWKAFVKSEQIKNHPEIFLIQNVLRGRDTFRGFSDSTTIHTWYYIANLLSSCRYNSRNVFMGLFDQELKPSIHLILDNLIVEVNNKIGGLR